MRVQTSVCFNLAKSQVYWDKSWRGDKFYFGPAEKLALLLAYLKINPLKTDEKAEQFEIWSELLTIKWAKTHLPGKRDHERVGALLRKFQLKPSL